MKNKFNDFSALKALKKDLEENNTSEVASLPKKRSRTVVHKPKEQRIDRPQALPNEISVDLHIEKIPTGYDAPEGFELPYQLEYFKSILHKYMKHRGMRISFIHGVGDGILRDAIRKEIDEVYALTCYWTPGPAGVTKVTIR